MSLLELPTSDGSKVVVCTSGLPWFKQLGPKLNVDYLD